MYRSRFALMEDELAKKETTLATDGCHPPLAAEKTELDCRLAEDDASPDDSVDWEIIKAEAQARWQQ